MTQLIHNGLIYVSLSSLHRYIHMLIVSMMVYLSAPTGCVDMNTGWICVQKNKAHINGVTYPGSRMYCMFYQQIGVNYPLLMFLFPGVSS